MKKPEEYKCHLVSWDDAYSLAKLLARNIKRSGYKPDLVIGIARGGLVPASIVCDFLHQKYLASIKVEHWGIASMSGKAKINYTLPCEIEISGKRILVVDDVADTGETYSVILNYLKENGACEIRTATLHYKTSSKFIPDYWGEKHEDWKWIIYPWAVYEDMIGFIQKVLAERKTLDALKKDLKSNFDIKIPIKELKEMLIDMALEGKLVRKKIRQKVFWELVT
jgi:hypoxanthine phosphoribosyltransferase